MSILRISHTNGFAEIAIDTLLPLHARVIAFSVNRGNEFDAVLLVERIRAELTKAMQAIRQEEYERGWKDRGAKRGKDRSFSEQLP